MSSMKKVGELEIEHDLQFQEKEWTVQRIGWVVMAIVIVAALFGLFGQGPLSKARAGSEADPLQAEYERFVRLEAPMMLRLQVGAGAVANGQARVWVDQEYLKDAQIEQVSPQPESVELTSDRQIYTFQVGDISEPTPITFWLRAHNIGLNRGQVGVDGGPSYHFNQFTYP